ncbi:hypothetical protein E2562_001473 [Oryza meyeriana var. granulata]|uniref:Hydrophobic seed protein domain-containing protein n=1 Tax=Oryza meyeriana var. granulata TaxID=110450 RepID=A0A6G1DCS7_9ORYZ|nr:hypothetical protein E2562_001473 [Oryza meyeriana var. granulata]
MGGGTRAGLSTIMMGKLVKLLLVLALVVAAGAHGGEGARAAGRSVLARPGPSCCTHDGNTVATGCCPPLV